MSDAHTLIAMVAAAAAAALNFKFNRSLHNLISVRVFVYLFSFFFIPLSWILLCAVVVSLFHEVSEQSSTHTHSLTHT